MSTSRARSWRCHVNEVLRNLQKRGPLLTSANLLSIRITMQIPTSILPPSILILQVQRFMNGAGPEWISKLNEELMSGRVQPDIRGTYAAEMFNRIVWMIGTNYFWRDYYGYVNPFINGCRLEIKIPLCGPSEVITYHAHAVGVLPNEKMLPVTTGVISHHQHPGPTTLSPAEAFCLIALAVESYRQRPDRAFHYVRIIAADNLFQLRRLRAKIPRSYLLSLFQPISPNDRLIDGFVVESTEYVTLFGSLQQLSRAMALMFEDWPSKETMDEGYQSNTGTPAEVNIDKLNEIEQSNSETSIRSQERSGEAMLCLKEPRSCVSDVSRTKIIRQAEWLQQR